MNTLAELTARLGAARRVLDREVGEAHFVATHGKTVAADIDALRADIDLHEQAAALLASIGEARQAAAQTQIETLVTQGLHTIFGEELSFHLVAAVRAKTPVLDLVVRSRLADDTVVDTKILDARGGGLAAVVGVLLRVVVLLLAHERRDIPLTLDESTAHLSAEYEPAFAAFLRQLVDLTGIQIILVTHSEAFGEVADTRYRFTLNAGVTTAHPL